MKYRCSDFNNVILNKETNDKKVLEDYKYALIKKWKLVDFV